MRRPPGLRRGSAEFQDNDRPHVPHHQELKQHDDRQERREEETDPEQGLVVDDLHGMAGYVEMQLAVADKPKRNVTVAFKFKFLTCPSRCLRSKLIPEVHKHPVYPIYYVS